MFNEFDSLASAIMKVVFKILAACCIPLVGTASFVGSFLLRNPRSRLRFTNACSNRNKKLLAFVHKK